MHDKTCRVECKLLEKDAKAPQKTRSTDVGYDVCSIIDSFIEPKSGKIIPTGIAVAVPPGYYYTIEGRSSMFMNDILTSNGIIDAGYCGHLKIHLVNMSNKRYDIKKGNKIAQIIIHKQYCMDAEEVQNFSQDYSSRGDTGQAGWGSSGK